MPDRHWQLLDSHEVSDERIFHIRHDRYQLLPDGGQRDFVVLDSPDWVNVVPLTCDNQVVLIRQFRHGLRLPTLEIPGGVVEAGESPADAAVRELREETGYEATEVGLLGRVAPNPAIQNNYCHLFVARDCRRAAAPRPDPFERIEVLQRPLEEIEGMIRQGQICHALVIDAFALLGVLGNSALLQARPAAHPDERP